MAGNRKLVKRGGVLQVEEAVNPIAQPKSPLDAASLGASPDSAKMVGSSAQKDAARAQTLRSETSDRAAKRQAKDITPDPVQVEATSQAQRIKTFGGEFDTWAESRFDRILTGTQANTQVVSDLEQIDPGLYKSMTDLLASGMSPDDVVAALGDSTAMSRDQLTNYVQGVGATLTDQAQANIQAGGADYAMSEEDFEQWGGRAQLSQELGIDIPEGTTVEELGQLIAAKEASAYNQVEGIQAQLMDPDITPARRAELTAELRQLGASGKHVAERVFEQMSDEVAEADVIEFNGQEYQLEDLLDNEAVSSSLLTALSSPEELEKLREAEPGFAAWIEENRDQLNAITDDIRSTTEGIVKSAELREDLETGFERDVADMFAESLGLDGEAANWTGEQVAKLEEFSQTDVFQTLKDNTGMQLSYKDTSPEVREKLAGMTADDIAESHEAATMLAADAEQGGVLSDIYGTGGGFVTDPDVRTAIARDSAILETVGNYPEDMKDWVTNALRSGELDAEVAEMISDPGEMDRLRSHIEAKEEFSKVMDSPDRVVGLITGDENMTWQDIQDMWNQAQMDLKLGWSASAAATLKKLAYFDSDGDFKISPQDKSQLAGEVSRLMFKDAKSVLKGPDLLGQIKENIASAGDYQTEPHIEEFRSMVTPDGQIRGDNNVRAIADRLWDRDPDWKGLFNKLDPKEQKRVTAANVDKDKGLIDKEVKDVTKVKFIEPSKTADVTERDAKYEQSKTLYENALESLKSMKPRTASGRRHLEDQISKYEDSWNAYSYRYRTKKEEARQEAAQKAAQEAERGLAKPKRTKNRNKWARQITR